MPDKPKHFVYILESARNRDRHYFGLTSDVPARLAAHNDARSLHTAKHGPWMLLVSMEFTDVTAAAGFERYLKTGSGRAFARRCGLGAPCGVATISLGRGRSHASVGWLSAELSARRLDSRR